jgi:hypothetical protein
MNVSPLTMAVESDAVAPEGEVLVVEGIPHWVTCPDAGTFRRR